MRSDEGKAGIPRLAAAGVVALVALGLILVLSRTGVPPQQAASSSTTSTETTAQVEIDAAAVRRGGASGTCPVTVPGDDAFTPASDAPDGPPSVHEVVWYGTPELWTKINPQGEINSKRWLQGDRTFWWSENYSRGDPAEITVTAEHLNGSAPTVEESAPAGSGFNPFMLAPTHESVTLVGVELPEPGCWELTAEYKGTSLSYVVWVSDD